MTAHGTRPRQKDRRPAGGHHASRDAAGPAVSAAGAQVIIHTARVPSGARPTGAIGISDWELPGVRWAP